MAQTERLPEMNEGSPIDTLINFFERLPRTIKKDVIGQVLLYAFRDADFNKSTDPEARLRNNLHERHTLAAHTIGLALNTIAATDYVLDHFTGNGTKNRNLIAQFAQKFSTFEPVLLGYPLRQKHFERARADFDLLKRGALSVHTLRAFENNLQKKLGHR